MHKTCGHRQHKKSWVKSTLLENVMWMSPKIFLVMQHLWQSQWGIGQRGVPPSLAPPTRRLFRLWLWPPPMLSWPGGGWVWGPETAVLSEKSINYFKHYSLLCSVVSFLVPRERVPRPNCIIKCKLWLWKEYDFMFYTLSSRPLLYTFLSERKKMFSATRINNLT